MATRYALSAAVALFIVATAGCQERADDTQPLSTRSNQPLLDSLSHHSFTRTGDGIGDAIEARFLHNSDRIAVLDQFPPHLRLFTLEGDPLWSGGNSGGGPAELSHPQSIGTKGDTVFVLQRGRVSQWHFQNDSLSFSTANPLPDFLFPLGVTGGCGNELLLYARDDRQFKAAIDSQEVAYLHRLSPKAGGFHIASIWRDRRDPRALAMEGHNGVLISHSGGTVVVLHRSAYFHPGRVIEFGCDGTPERVHEEQAMVVGDSLPVKAPRPKAPQWTTGIAALAGGFVTLQQRFEKMKWRGNRYVSDQHSEIFIFSHRGFCDSALIAGLWTVMDFDATKGLLLATKEPVPHFVTIPPEILTTAHCQEGAG